LAAATLSKRHDWTAVRSFCVRETFRVLRCPTAAEDAAQEALARAWLKWDRCHEEERRAAWLGAIARNEALRLRARQHGRREVPLEEDDGAGVPQAEPGASVAERLEVRRAVGHLKEVDQELVRLRYFEDLPHAEVAEQMGMTEATVRVRLHRLRRRLERELGDQAAA
jgi:RNA polymerase sigma-70 factor (ECF subfamily)